MKISKNIFLRYEENIKDGTLYIYNVDTEILVKSNEFTFHVLHEIDQGIDDEKEIINNIKKYYEGYTYEEISIYVKKIILFSKENGILE